MTEVEEWLAGHVVGHDLFNAARPLARLFAGRSVFTK